jgi:hydroxymethylpyrimidine/phosphomethylpyrimidine kinase
LSNHNSHHPAPPVVLVIAGFDPSCGAGVAADLKTVAAHNCYGVAAITALTVQSTQGVKSIHVTSASALREQLDTLAEDIAVAAVKIGMLGNRLNAAVVAEFLDRTKLAPVVLDPVIAPTSGGPNLLDSAGLKFLNEELVKRATVITPNVPEAVLLTGVQIKDVSHMEAAARQLVERGAKAAVVKGGHMEKPVDVLFDGHQAVVLGGDLVRMHHNHGSGCTLASAIAAHLALGRGLTEAVMLAKTYVTKAMEHGFSIGKGPGPLDHFYRTHQEPPPRGIHEVPQHGLHPAAEPATR